MKNWLCISAGIVVGEWLYFTISNGNGLFRCNMENGRIDYLGRFPKEKENQSHSFYRISRYENKLFFWAHQAANHAMYDLQNDRFIEFTCENLNVNLIENLVIRNQYIYLYGRHDIPYIYRYDTKQMDGRYIFRNMHTVEKEYSSLTILASGMDYDDERAYLPCLTDTILTFDWQTEKLSPIYLPLRDACYAHIISVEDSLFLLDLAGRIMRYDKRTGEIRILFDVKDSRENDMDRRVEYDVLIRYKEWLYMISNKKGCEIICYNYKTGETYSDEQSFMRSNIGYVELHGRMLYAFDNLKGTLVRIDLKTHDTVEIDCTDVFHIAG